MTPSGPHPGYDVLAVSPQLHRPLGFALSRSYLLLSNQYFFHPAVVFDSCHFKDAVKVWEIILLLEVIKCFWYDLCSHIVYTAVGFRWGYWAWESIR